jgi:hypothetical protein
MADECMEQALTTARGLSKMVNVMNNQKAIEAFVNAVLTDHRTLQQSTFRVFMQLCAGWDKLWHEGRFDDRNRQTCEAAHKVMEAVVDMGFPYI